MPVDPEPVFIIEGDGLDHFVTDEGAVLLGRRALTEEEKPGLEVAFVPHWKTCPEAARFRRRKYRKEIAIPCRRRTTTF